MLVTGANRPDKVIARERPGGRLALGTRIALIKPAQQSNRHNQHGPGPSSGYW